MANKEFDRGSGELLKILGLAGCLNPCPIPKFYRHSDVGPQSLRNLCLCVNVCHVFFILNVFSMSTFGLFVNWNFGHLDLNG